MAGVDEEIRRLAELHHDALLVDLLGAANSGLPPDRLQELRARGLIAADGLGATEAWRRQFGGGDALSVTIALADLMERMSSLGLSDDYQSMQRMPLDAVLPRLAPQARKIEQHPAEASPGAVVVPAHGHAPPHVPDVPPPADPVAEAGGSHLQPPQKPPVPPHDRDTYGESVSRIGMFCRGLGNEWSTRLQEMVGERWDGETLESAPKPGAREAALTAVRRAVQTAWESHRSPQLLAKEMARQTGDFSRDWRRIAETELQALYNETVIRHAVERWGDKIRIARVPESSACDDCLRLFLGADGLPILWKVNDLLANGTNVGKTKAQWRGSAYPLHPRCRCNTTAVPEGARVDRQGRIWFSAATPQAA